MSDHGFDPVVLRGGKPAVYSLVVMAFLVNETSFLPFDAPSFKGSVVFKNSYGFLPLNMHPLLVVCQGSIWNRMNWLSTLLVRLHNSLLSFLD